MGGSGSGRWGSSRRPIAEGLQRFDLAEYLRRSDAVKPNASCIATISNGKISAQIRYTETSTCFGGRRAWMSGQGSLLPGTSSSRTFVLSCCTLFFEGLALMYRYIRALGL